MDHHQSHLRRVDQSSLRTWVFWLALGISSAAEAGSFAELAQITERRLGFSVGVPNLVEPVLELDHAAGITSEFRAIAAPLPLGSLGTYVYSHFEAQLRYRPQVFSVASGFGFQSLSLTLPLKLGNLASEVTSASTSAGFQSFYWTVSVGWRWTWASGFGLGFGASVRVPIVGWGGIAVVSGASSQNATSFLNSSVYPMTRLASLVHPSLQLIELSWRF